MTVVEIRKELRYGAAAGAFKFYPGKSSDGAKGLFIEGYASTRDLDRTGEIVEPEAFRKSLPEFLANPILTYMHSWSDPIGRVVQARIDERGLWVKAFISKTAGRIIELIKEGILRAFSIGFEVLKEEQRGGVTHLLEVKLYEIAVVTIPANPETLFQLSKALERGASVAELKQMCKGESKSASVGIDVVPDRETIIEIIADA